MLDAVYQSLVIFFIAVGAYAGSDIDIWEFGTTITTSCLYTCLVQGAILIRSWVKSNYFTSINRINAKFTTIFENHFDFFYFQTILHVASLAFSLLSFYLFAITYNGFCVTCFGIPSNYWVIFHCVQSPVHWAIIALTVVICVLPK